jgi:hypothetical protein
MISTTMLVGVRVSYRDSRGFGIATEGSYRRPFRQHWRSRWGEFAELISGIHWFATDDREHRFEAFDLILGNRKVIGRKHGQVR